MKKFFIPLLLTLLLTVGCFVVASAEEFGGTYTMPGEVMVGADGKASFDIVMTPYDASLYNGYQFHLVPGVGITIDFVTFSRNDIAWSQPMPTNPPDGRINFGIYKSGTDEQNVISGPITCTVNISFIGDAPVKISFERKGDYNPDNVGIYKMVAIAPGSTISTPLDGPKNITILPYMWNSHIVTFHSNNGTEVDRQIVENGKPALKPDDPSKTGFAFAGWYENADFSGSAYSFLTPITDDLDLYAKWIPLHTIAFISNGGAPEPAEQTVIDGGKATKPDAMIKLGYTFIGWYSDEDCTTEYDFAASVTGSFTLYAKWQINTYTVTFDSLDGSSVPQQTVNHGDKATEPTEPTKIGFAFDGWYTDKDCTSIYDFNIPVTDSFTLYAKWQINTYTVTYKVVNGTWADGNTADMTESVTYNESPTNVPVDMIANVGHGSGSWSSDPETAVITGNTTFTFTFIPNTYTVTYKVVNGTWADETSADITESVTYNESPTNVPTGMLANAGHGSGSWSSDPETAVITGNTTFTYIFVLKKYDVTFYPNNNNEKTVVPTEHGDLVVKPATPTREGYKFGDWYDNTDFNGTPYNFNTPVTDNLDLYARWISSDTPTYTITFHPNDGIPEPVGQIVVEGKKAISPPDMIRSGYIFGGWYSNVAYIGAPFSFDTPITDNLDLYAKWIPDNKTICTVTFHPNGGTPAPVKQMVIEGKKAIEPPEISKLDSIFGGWYDNDEFEGAPYSFDTQVNDSLELYAKWIPDSYTTYTVIFLPQEGIPAPAKQIVIAGEEAIKPPEISKTGYTFVGWYRNSAFTGTLYDFETPVNDNLNLYARWQINTYNVTFNTNEGTDVPKQIINYEGYATKPIEPTKDDHEFGGWYENEDFEGSPYSFETPVTSDLTLFARWIPTYRTIYTVTFNPNGGVPAPAEQKVIEGEKAGQTNVARLGYSFGGWFDNDDLDGIPYDFDTPVTADLHLYAKWETKTYTVTFNSMGGTSVPSQTIDHGKKFEEPIENEPEREGYFFGLWYDDPTFTKAPYSFDTTVTADLILYARWISVGTNVHIVTFTPNGGIPAPSRQIVVDGKYAVKPEVARSGYNLESWYNNNTGSSFSFTTQVTADLDLYAKWNPIYTSSPSNPTYTVTFNSNGGSAISTQTVVSGSKASKPANPTKLGYKFVDWYSDSSLTKLYNFDAPVLNDLTLYARWEEGDEDGLIKPSERNILGDDDQGPTFIDVPETHWAYQYVEYLARRGYVTGKTTTIFFPGDPITRAEFVTILARMEGVELSEYNGPFVDVDPDAYYAGAVEWAIEAGVTIGTSETTFSPSRTISRQEIATMLARYLTYKEIELTPYNEEFAFTDEALIADYAKEHVRNMQIADILGGYSDGSFKPLGNTTRAEAAKMLALVHYLANQE